MTAPFATLLITDATRLGPEPTLDILKAVLPSGIGGVQVREKTWEARPLADFTRQVLALARPWGVRVLVNGRVDVALAAGADGVHLGGGALHPEAAREMAHLAGRDDLLIGISTHSRADVARASAGGADYVLFGPLYATPGKAQYGEPQGEERLGGVCADGWVPVLAIGGITPQNAAGALAAGAAGSACIRAVFDAFDPAEAARAWVESTPGT